MNTKDMEEMLNIILHCSYKLVEIDQRNRRNQRRRETGKTDTNEKKDTTPDGIASRIEDYEERYNEKNLSEKNYNTEFYDGVISDVKRKNSTNDNPMIIITVVLDNGITPKKAFTHIDGNDGVKYHILNDFMKPLGITGFSKSTPIEQFFEFPFEDYIGTRVRVSLGDDYKEIPQIEKFSKFVNRESSWLDWSDEIKSE